MGGLERERESVCVCVCERERERVEKLVVHCDMNTRSGKRRMVNPSVAEKLKEKTKEKRERKRK